MKLLAGPWVGEFGWEICTWVPALRKHAEKFDNVVIVCRGGHGYLYKDFADKIISCDKQGDADRWLLNDKKVKMPKGIISSFPDHKLCRPRGGKCMNWPRKYFKYGRNSKEQGYQIVFHARHMKKYGQSKLNYPPARYEKAIKKLKINPEECASIGSRSGAYYVKGTKDLREMDMEKLCGTLANSSLCVGTSSGPMHLASFCGCPHIVITGNEHLKIINGTNRDRYKRLWNPFKTECKILDRHHWQPPVKDVVKTIKGML